MNSDASHYGTVSLRDNVLHMTSVDELPCFELRLDNVAQCVIPGNNPNELEVSFPDNDAADKDEDCLAQITMHFPYGDPDDEETPAQSFQKEIMSTGAIKSITGDIICEFSKDQGNFVTPRGKYGIQMLSSYMHMQGAQYSYKIKYTDITKTFLLDKPDGVRAFFVIVLDKPIRQGTQKYQSLVIETNKMEHALKINLTEAEIAKDYDGQLQTEMTGSLSTNIAKVFKVLAQVTVFVPKQFKSFRDEFSVRSTYKTNEGLLYPLSKVLLFVHKPTIIINFEDIASIEMQRYGSNTGTGYFDIEVVMKKGKGDSGGETKYMFQNLDKAEGTNLSEYFQTKNVTVIKPASDDRKAKAYAGMDGGDDDDEDEEEDDGDYKMGQSSGSENDSDDSGGSQDEGDGGGEDNEKPKAKKRPAVAKASKSTPKEKAPRKTKEPKEPGAKKAKAKKDKNAPKHALSAYMYFSAQNRMVVKGEHPSMSMTDIAKELGTRWKLLGAEDKEEFEEMAKLDKERYATEIASYKAKLESAGGSAEGMDVSDADGEGDSD